MEKKFNELLREIYKILKPLGYRKDGANYRLFKSKAQTKQHSGFPNLYHYHFVKPGFSE